MPARTQTAAMRVLGFMLVLGVAAAARLPLDAKHHLGFEAPTTPRRRLQQSGDVPLKIVHLNDNHARFDPATTSFGPCSNPASCFGGFARLATAVKQARTDAAAAGQDILVLHAGDQFTGTAWDFVYTKDGNHVAHLFLNSIGIDAFTLGNHEFDYRPSVLAPFVSLLNATVVSCNVDASQEPLLAGKIRPFVVLTLPISGAKVAIIGLTTQETATSSSPGALGSRRKDAFVGPNVAFNDPTTSLPTCAAAAKAAGATIVIALTHVGADLDVTLAGSAAAADVGLVLGGHSHTLFYTGTPPNLLTSPVTPESSPVFGAYPLGVANAAANKTIPVAQALWASRYVGVLDTVWSATGDLLNATGRPVLLGGTLSTNSVADDAATAAQLTALRGPVDALSNRTIGATSTYLTGPAGEPGTPDASLANPVRMRETNLGDFFCEALRWYVRNQTNLLSSPSLAGLPLVGLYNGGGIRASVPPGTIKQGDMVNISPFGNWAVVKLVNASTLVAALANGVSQWATVGPAGRFPQVAGVRYAFNSSAPAASRLGRVVLEDGRELGTQYTGLVVLVTNNFMALPPGGDGYTMLGSAPLLLDASQPLDQVVGDYIRSLPSPIAPTTDGRIADCAVTPSAPLCPAGVSGGQVKLKIVHLNDNHARFDPATTSFGPCSNPASCFGGFARLATAVKQARTDAAAAGQDILVLHAGDQFTGTAWDFVYTKDGNHVAHLFLNSIGIDAFTLGNHEFDYRPSVLAPFVSLLNATVVSCNVDASQEPLLAGKIRPFVVLTLPISGAKVAIIGLTTQETATSSSPGALGSRRKDAFVGPNVAFNDPTTSLPTCAAAAKAAGATIVIALTHVGADLDVTLAGSAAAADVGLVLGGHSHTLFYTGTPPNLLTSPVTPESSPVFGAYPLGVANAAANKTIPVAQALWASRYVGVLDTVWSATGDLLNATGRPVLLGGTLSTNSVADDAATAAQLTALRGPVDALSNRTIGATSTYLTGPAGEPGTPDASLANPVRMRETNLGDFFCEALRWYVRNQTNLLSSPSLAGLPLVGLYNGGGIRASVPPGTIKQGDMVNISPFGNWAVVKLVNASTLVAALANGVSQWATVGPAGRFPQVAGVRYAFNSSAPAASRLGRVVLEDGRELGTQYTGLVVLVTNNFMALPPGGDGYTMLGSAPLLLDASQPLDQVVGDYIRSLPSPIAPTTDGRIADCAMTPGAPLCPSVAFPLSGLPAKQSSTAATTFKATKRKITGAASLGVDGAFDDFTRTGISAKTVKPWFEVDLKSNVTLASVTLFAPALKTGEAVPVTYNASNQFLVRISGLPSSKTVLYTGPLARRCGVLRGPLLTGAGATIACELALPPGAPQGSPPQLPQGRYLSIELQQTKAVLSFAELAITVKAG